MFYQFQQRVCHVFYMTYQEHLPFFFCDSCNLPVVFNNALSVLPYLHICQSQDIDWAVGFVAEESWFDSWHGQKILFFSTMSGPVLGTTQPHV
jgi:hypothetical protein